MSDAMAAVRLLHIVSVVLMAAPYYNLVIVNGRAALGPGRLILDRYMENLVRGNAVRCFVLQASALATGLALVWSDGTFRPLRDSPILQTKLGLLLLLVASLSIVHLGIQPRIDRMLAPLSEDALPPEVGRQIRPLRVLRKRMAAGCLFVLLTLIILAVQVRTTWPVPLFLGAEAAAAGLTYAAYRRGAPWAWV